MKVGIVQFQNQGSKQKNLLKSVQLIRLAHKKGAEVICLQELFLTEYFCFEENEVFFDLADEFRSSLFLKELLSLTKELRVVLVASFFEKRTAGLYHNTALVLDNGTVLGKYRKQHIPDDPGYYEKYYFAPGDNGYKVFETSYGKIGVLICWDQWFPEASRITALKGAEVLFYPTAIGWSPSDDERIKEEELNAWKIMHQSHAIANGVAVVAVNRIGVENGLQFWGNSFVCNAFGSVVTALPQEEEGVQIALVDKEDTEFYRRRWPFLRDRRLDTYSCLLKRMDDE